MKYLAMDLDIFKSFLVIPIVTISLLCACSSAPPLTEENYKKEQNRLNQVLLNIRMGIKQNNAQLVYQYLSQHSKDWFLDMRNSANSEAIDYLKERPFYEVLCILALRLEVKLRPHTKLDPVSILKRVMIDMGPIKKSFIKYPLGDFHIQQFRAEIGLKKASNVPVFFFVLEDEQWRLNLVQSLPLLLLGAENFARQKYSETIQQSLYLLEKISREKFTPEELLR